MKNTFAILCSTTIPIFSLKEVTPKLCVNCKFFINTSLEGNPYGRCSLFKKTGMDIDYLVPNKDSFL